MKAKLKPIKEQVVLITGASSGIGRQAALRFAAAGAKVIAVSRNLAALQTLTAEIAAEGGEAIAAAADAADIPQFTAVAEQGVAKFGRIDTWVNNAGVGMYTKILTTDVVDDRRLFETNFWGIVNGSRIAVSYLRAAGGGALINLGSEVSDIAVPIQGMYATSKHAIMGFTDALREELIADQLPISVTLIKPAAINTPFPHHAKNNLDQDATLPGPVYAVDIAVDQILHAAVHGGLELYAGGGGRLMAFAGNHMPSIFDRFMAFLGGPQQLANRPADHANEALHSSRGFHLADGDVEKDRHIHKISLYGMAVRNPVTSVLVASAAVIGLSFLVKHSTPDE